MSSFTIRPLHEQELPEADRVCRLAFGTAAGLPDPLQMFGDADYMHRWYLKTGSAIAAYDNDQIIGTNFLSRWGSLGGFGPLTVHPNYWNQGVASQLMTATMAQFEHWQTPAIAFFTSSHSPKHLWFYRKFGFSPGYLTTVLKKAILDSAVHAVASASLVYYSTLTPQQQQEALLACSGLTGSIYPGLDWTAEIQLVQQRQIGETLLLWNDAGLAAFAICHCGSGSEAGNDNCYIKFAAARPGAKVEARFEQLLDACERFTAEQQLKTLTAGVNTSRHDAYNRMLARGFQIGLIGVTMHQHPQCDYCRPDVYALDDRR